MSFAFHPEAEAEFDKAIEYYGEMETGLGYGLAIESLLLYSALYYFPEGLACH